MDQDNQKRTVWCGNLSSNCTEELIYELFLQVAPLEKISLCADKDGKKNSYAFITFKHLISVEYAINALNGIHLFDKKIIVRNTNSNNSSMEEKTKPENIKPSHYNNSFERFDRSITASSTPDQKYERRNYNTDRHSNNRHNFENWSRDHRSYNDRSRHSNSFRSHPYNHDKRKPRYNYGNSY